MAEAEHLLAEALEIARSTHNAAYEVDAMDIVARLHTKRGNYDRARERSLEAMRGFEARRWYHRARYVWENIWAIGAVARMLPWRAWETAILVTTWRVRRISARDAGTPPP